MFLTHRNELDNLIFTIEIRYLF